MLDVTDPEPLPRTSRLYDLPNVVITPHIAGSLGSETARMTSALDELSRHLDGRSFRDPIFEDQLALAA